MQIKIQLTTKNVRLKNQIEKKMRPTEGKIMIFSGFSLNTLRDRKTKFVEING